ncbi:family 16 glycosylhydrolase [Mesorhizobium sp.]|uniref:family 16 glycosylhydrolase n=1 Tax=Mesorhizobium sp. TaxID=1871066 RepID=UPI000FE8F48B|nr:family 16 glycosylhydrolase [Mesorhizobium sp.]RWI29560.1 MAG: glycosyl hydrolase family protein [Mesorhizobium sp.]RWK52523.1 MAG: glycosyl hydrolase family protein [Mesorhizobium sp.]RWK97582.1 MAG: glycosyl hydrolase family protein [Mesorhizobium sp.]TIQ29683.1 MAG: glycosyl hydrolase family protein [Mesorhizobium sp.]TJW51761.1 MAG: glycosyl hydrolase family protein [Mesorhizobium sp.]
MAAITLPGDWTGQYKGSTLNLSGFKLSFSDEFNTLDVVPNNGTGKWFAPVHAPYGAATFMSPVGATNPFSVSDGKLTITMKQVDGAWQSGTMQTVNSAGQGFAQQYGYFEMRAAFHGGAGAWPAFWMLSPNQTVPRVEVDIVEAYGGDPDGHHQAVHLSNKESHAWESNYTGLPASMFDGAFHTYGARITTDWITVYYDGKELSRFPMSESFRTPLYMLASLAMNPLEVERASGTYKMVIDYVRAYAAPDVMEQHLTGTDAADILNGGSFDDVLDGGAGADKMSGGAGNDTYRVDNASDVVIEADGAGIDLVITSMTYSLSGQRIEQLTLTGVADIDAKGNELDNTLVGNAGSNLLDGGVGIDKMEGGAGDDTYYLDNALDRVVEGDAAGNDWVFSSITYSLPRYVENLTLVGLGAINGRGNSSDNELTGNNGNNTLDGLAGNDTIRGGAGSDRLAGYDGADLLDGGTGADLMNGGTGNDTYYVDNILDNVIDEAGVDQIFSLVTYSLAVANREVENLRLTGSANVGAKGNSLDNVLDGNDSDNKLDGGRGNDTVLGWGGNDTLMGGLGIDRLTGGAGNDFFVFSAPLSVANRDIITDFNHTADAFRLENSVMQGLGATGALDPRYFFAGTSAHDANDHIVYDNVTGELFYDSNGNVAGGVTQLATLTNRPTLLADDFFVI